MTDTFWADTSEHQRSTYNDSYPHRIACFRSNDGTYRDNKFAANLAWARKAADEGRIDAFIIYFVWRQNWSESVETHIQMCGTPHPRQASMLDIESWGGKITGNQSDGINRAYWRLSDYYGDKRRTIGYGGAYDLPALWPDLPPDVRLIIAGYGTNPGYKQKFAHQYTDGAGFGAGLPEGAPPFGNCDMNVADGMSPVDVASMLGIGTPLPQQGADMTPEESRKLDVIYDQMTRNWDNPLDPAGTHGPGQGTVVEMVARAHYELTQVLTDRSGISPAIADTLLGHAIFAMSYGRQLVDIGIPAIIAAVAKMAADTGSTLTMAQIAEAVHIGMADGVHVEIAVDGRVIP